MLVDFFDASALAEQVGALLADVQMRKTLGENARAFARAHYDLNSQCLPKQIAWVEQLPHI
jgi:hypothetical protein